MEGLTILFKRVNGYPTHVCDVFEDGELFNLILEGWLIVE